MWFFLFAKNGGFEHRPGDFSSYTRSVVSRSRKGLSVAGSKAGGSLWSGTRKNEGGEWMTVDGTNTVSYSGVDSYDDRGMKESIKEEERRRKQQKLERELIIKEEKMRFAARSVVARNEKGRKGILAKRGWGGSHSFSYEDDFTDYGDGVTLLGDDDGHEMREVHEERERGGKYSPYKDNKSPSTPKSKRNNKNRGRKVSMPGGFGGVEQIMEEVELEGDEEIDTPTKAHRGHRSRGEDVENGDDIKAYRYEKVARVGGMNRRTESSAFDRSVSGSEVSYASPIHKNVTSPRSPTSPGLKSAEQKAKDEAAKMERQWRREARRAAADVARENGRTIDMTPVGAGIGGIRRSSRSPTKMRNSRLASGENYTFSSPTSDREGQKESYLDAYRPKR